MMKPRREVFRASLEGLVCCIISLLVLLGLIWLCFSVAEYSVKDEPRVWPALIVLPLLVAAVLVALKNYSQTKVVLDPTKIVFRNGKAKKEILIKDIERVEYGQIGGFDCRHYYLVFIHLCHELREEEFLDDVVINHFFPHISAGKTVVLDLSPFDRKVISKILLFLHDKNPQIPIIVGAHDEWQIKRWQDELAGIGGEIERLPNKGEWRIRRCLCVLEK